VTHRSELGCDSAKIIVGNPCGGSTKLSHLSTTVASAAHDIAGLDDAGGVLCVSEVTPSAE